MKWKFETIVLQTSFQFHFHCFFKDFHGTCSRALTFSCYSLIYCYSFSVFFLCLFWRVLILTPLSTLHFCSVLSAIRAIPWLCQARQHSLVYSRQPPEVRDRKSQLSSLVDLEGPTIAQQAQMCHVWGVKRCSKDTDWHMSNNLEKQKGNCCSPDPKHSLKSHTGIYTERISLQLASIGGY